MLKQVSGQHSTPGFLSTLHFQGNKGTQSTVLVLSGPQDGHTCLFQIQSGVDSPQTIHTEEQWGSEMFMHWAPAAFFPMRVSGCASPRCTGSAGAPERGGKVPESSRGKNGVACALFGVWSWELVITSVFFCVLAGFFEETRKERDLGLYFGSGF